MDRASLERLRKKYNDTKGGQVFDPEFRKVAERIFDKNGTRLGAARIFEALWEPGQVLSAQLRLSILHQVLKEWIGGRVALGVLRLSRSAGAGARSLARR